MTAAREIVRFDLPWCEHEWGDGTCRARLGYDGVVGPRLAGFAGSSAAILGSGLTGAADAKLFTAAGLFLVGAIGSEQTLIAGATSLSGATLRFRISVTNTGRLWLLAQNAAGSTILDVQSSVLSANTVYHFAASFDLTDTGKRHLYLDDASDLAIVSTYTDDAMDLTLADWSAGARPDGSTAPLSGFIGLLWLDLGNYLDLSIEANRRKFIDAAGRPVQLGDNGATPTGSQPIVFLDGPRANWPDNLGSGGDFTLVGDELTELVMGPIKCFNMLARPESAGACFDRETFAAADPAPELRFTRPSLDRRRDIEALPLIQDVEYTPGTISLGEGLGKRATLRVRLRDVRHPDAGDGFDKYRAERGYSAYERGTLFGRLGARWPFHRDTELEWLIGYDDAAIGAMAARAFVIDSLRGPGDDGVLEIVSSDILKLADALRTKAPTLSLGYLASGIDAVTTSATLAPSGVGASYNASGTLNIGGSEIATFTRSGDALTLTRGQLGTTAVAHDAEERCQAVLRFLSASPADMVAHYTETVAGIPNTWIPLSTWLQEVNSFIPHLFTGIVAEPTPVDQLIEEILEQAALWIYADERAREIKLGALRPIDSSAALFTARQMRSDRGLEITEQPDRRLSEVHVYFAQANPLLPLDNRDNYRAVARLRSPVADDYDSDVIKEIFSRWIPDGGRAIATTLAANLLARRSHAPRRFGFSLPADPDNPDQIVPGAGYRISGQPLQDLTGAPAQVAIQVTSVRPSGDEIDVEAEEAINTPLDETANARDYTIETDTLAFNLRTSWEALYGPPSADTEFTCYINPGVVVGALSTSGYSFDTGDWPTGVAITLVNRGLMVGHSGRGGDGANANVASPGAPGNDGGDGGPALGVRIPIDLDNSDGIIGGGGGGGGGGGSGQGGGGSFTAGGGGGGGGGSGAGRNQLTPGNGGAGHINNGFGTGDAGLPGLFGNAQLGGDRGNGGAGGSNSGNQAGRGGNAGLGGDLGQPGGDGEDGQPANFSASKPATAGGDGGSPGAAIEGWSLVTVVPSGTGSILGPTTG